MSLPADYPPCKTPEWFDFNDPWQRALRWLAWAGFIMGIVVGGASQGRPEHSFMLMLGIFMGEMVLINEVCARRQRQADISPTVPGDSQER